MITQKELLETLKESGLKFVFNQWKKDPNGKPPSPPPLPYLVYSIGYSNDLIADNQNYLHTHEVHIDLYQNDSFYDFELEKRLRHLLRDKQIPFRMGEVIHLETERMYETTLTVTVIEKD